MKIYSNGIPGPGNYETMKGVTGVGNKFGREVNQNKRKKGPGPGTYSVTHNDRMVSYSMAKRT